jgi:hypothetical protein
MFISKRNLTELNDDVFHLKNRCIKLERWIAAICEHLQIDVVESTRISPNTISPNSAIKVIKHERKGK